MSACLKSRWGIQYIQGRVALPAANRRANVHLCGNGKTEREEAKKSLTGKQACSDIQNFCETLFGEWPIILLGWTKLTPAFAEHPANKDPALYRFIVNQGESEH